MKYEKYDIVITVGQKTKKIESYEIVAETIIYYMTDNTSFAEHQILRCANDYEIQKFNERQLCDAAMMGINKFFDDNSEYYNNFFKEWYEKFKQYN